jgi:aerobic-type carbon monoxide dehydrogenase small subunit (CoxS/CutS family)
MRRHKKPNGKPGVSRRNFLQTAGIAGGAVASGLLVKPAGRVRAAPSPASAPLGPGPVEVTLEVNGQKHVLKLEPRVTLLEALREHLGLTGTKRICDHGECSACTVLVDGRATCSCMTLALDAQGKKITTIEGLARGKTLAALQKAFIDHDAFQCGFCTPGMILSLKALLDKHPQATAEQVKAAVAGNYCRCGALPNILKAGNAVAKG